MGFLDAGEPMTWEEVCAVKSLIVKHGVIQFLNLWRANKSRDDSANLLWGDEIEYQLVEFDQLSSRARIKMGATELTEYLMKVENSLDIFLSTPSFAAFASLKGLRSDWRPEFGDGMVEALPRPVFRQDLIEVSSVLSSIRCRRLKIDFAYRCWQQSISAEQCAKYILSHLTSGFIAQFDYDAAFSEISDSSDFFGQYETASLGLSVFPALGQTVDNFVSAENGTTANESGMLSCHMEDWLSLKDSHSIQNDSDRQQQRMSALRFHPFDIPSHSQFIPPLFTNSHPRFPTLMRNIRHRREAKVHILQPIFEDENTFQKIWSNNNNNKDTDNKLDRFAIDENSRKTANPVVGQIYMDAMGFGMGNSCVQVTFLAKHLKEARYLTDQFAVLAPWFLALTAASPVLRGMVAATDVRWDVIGQSVDCRTVLEENGVFRKSRYSDISLFIGEDDLQVTSLLNDVSVPINIDAKEVCEESGVDSVLATHIGYLFSRDPLVIFKGKVELNDALDSSHFENLQSTNWNSVRFKPPPASVKENEPNNIGWRVEFRTPELQLHDWENASVVMTLLLLTKALRASSNGDDQFDGRIPMSYMEQNFDFCKKENNIALDQKKGLTARKNGLNNKWDASRLEGKDKDEYIRQQLAHDLTLADVFCGNDEVSGLLPFLRSFLNKQQLHAGEDQLFEKSLMERALNFIELRAKGVLLTNAAFFRSFVLNHEEYKKDSLVSPKIIYDLLTLTKAIAKDECIAPELLGCYQLMVTDNGNHNSNNNNDNVKDSLVVDNVKLKKFTQQNKTVKVYLTPEMERLVCTHHGHHCKVEHRSHDQLAPRVQQRLCVVNHCLRALCKAQVSFEIVTASLHESTLDHPCPSQANINAQQKVKAPTALSDADSVETGASVSMQSCCEYCEHCH